MKYRIEQRFLQEDVLHIRGWAAGDNPESPVVFAVTRKNGTKVPFEKIAMRRDDVAKHLYGREPGEEAGAEAPISEKQGETSFRPGFDVFFPCVETEEYTLTLACEGVSRHEKLKPSLIRQETGHEREWTVRLRHFLDSDRAKDLFGKVKEMGVQGVFGKARERASRHDYDAWLAAHRPSGREKEQMRTPDFPVDVRFTYHHMPGIAEKKAENFARDQIFIPEGAREFVLFLAKDQFLEPSCLYEMAKAAAGHPEAVMLYTDEDCLDAETGKLLMPFMKPDWDPELLRATPYIGRCFAVDAAWLQAHGGDVSDNNPAWDYELQLRLSETDGEKVHIPKVLVHSLWRGQKISYEEDMSPERDAACRKALTAHLNRLHIPAQILDGPGNGTFHISRKIMLSLPGTKESGTDRKAASDLEPMVSIIIPNKDHADDLKKCLTSLMDRLTWEHFEILVVENNSEDPEIFDYYSEIEETWPDIRVLNWKDDFNFSEINNFAAAKAKGDFLLFMNNDTELITEDLIEELLGYCQDEKTAICGARLLYPDTTIQHAGVFLGLTGLVDHGFQGMRGDEEGLFYRPLLSQELSAVTAACMMVRRDVFEEVGGFEEDLAVSFNDADLCLRVREEGYRVVYDPYAVMYHYESKSRGVEDTQERQDRLQREIDLFRKRWSKLLAAGDPFYSPNLTCKARDFSLRWDE